MEKALIEKYTGQKVFIILKNHFKYTFDLDSDCFCGDSLRIIDKFGKVVFILISDVALIKEAYEKEGGKRK
ncbi:hypothetical protein ES703_50470 [subsurface metagenome]